MLSPSPAASRDWCGRQGATLLYNRRVVASEASGDRIAAIRTDQDRIIADAYVLAAGAEAPRLMRPLGCRLPIIPVKGYSLTLPRSAWPEAPTVPVLDERRKFGYAPLGADRLRLSGFAEIAGYDTTPQPRRTAGLPARLHRPVPQLAGVVAKHRDAALLLPAPGDAERPADPRPRPLPQPPLQRRPRPPRLDARARHRGARGRRRSTDKRLRSTRRPIGPERRCEDGPALVIDSVARRYSSPG